MLFAPPDPQPVCGAVRATAPPLQCQFESIPVLSWKQLAMALYVPSVGKAPPGFWLSVFHDEAICNEMLT